jgi:GNAT superfamily N-acetyltransferase
MRIGVQDARGRSPFLRSVVEHEAMEKALKGPHEGIVRPIAGEGHLDPTFVLPAESQSAFTSPSAQSDLLSMRTRAGGGEDNAVFAKMKQLGHRPDSPMPLWGRQHAALVLDRQKTKAPFEKLRLSGSGDVWEQGDNLMKAVRSRLSAAGENVADPYVVSKAIERLPVGVPQAAVPEVREGVQHLFGRVQKNLARLVKKAGVEDKTAEVYMKKYVGTHVKVPADMTSFVDPEAAKYRAQKFGRTHHVTLLTPDEIERLKKKGHEPAYIKQVFDSVPTSTMSIKREPMVFDTPRRVYNVLPVSWPEAQKAREQFGLRPSNLHVTVGATEKDRVGDLSTVKLLLSKDDRQQAASLERRVFSPSIKYQDPKPPSDKKYVEYGVFDGGKLVGMTRVNSDPLQGFHGPSLQKLKEFKPEVWINSTVVDPEYRGQGVGKALRSHLQKRYDSILSATDSESDPAMQHLNAQQGFEKVFERGRKVTWHWSKEKDAPKLEKVADWLLGLVRSQRAKE